MIDAKKLLEQEEYNFVRLNQDLTNSIYLVLSGSYGYGTNQEGSDIDLRGVAIEHKKYIYGIDNFEQFEDDKTDTVIYGLKKFVRLCMNGNPNALELLGVNENCIVLMNEKGRLLRENVHLFYSKAIIHTFGNYALAQLRRLENSLVRDQYPSERKEKHITDTIQKQMKHFNHTYTAFDENSIQLYTAPSLKKNMDQEIMMDINLKQYPVRDFCNIYSEMMNVIKSYNKLTHRNRKKDEQHLLKHGMHLLRILVTGKDILEGKGIITYREKEQALFMDIRQGKYSYEDLFQMAEKMIAEFEYAAEYTELLETVDNEAIRELLYVLYK